MALLLVPQIFCLGRSKDGEEPSLKERQASGAFLSFQFLHISDELHNLCLHLNPLHMYKVC